MDSLIKGKRADVILLPLQHLIKAYIRLLLNYETHICNYKWQYLNGRLTEAMHKNQMCVLFRKLQCHYIKRLQSTIHQHKLALSVKSNCPLHNYRCKKLKLTSRVSFILLSSTIDCNALCQNQLLQYHVILKILWLNNAIFMTNKH